MKSRLIIIVSALVACAAAADAPSAPEHFHVTVPDKVEAFPKEPAASTAPRFKWRGTKGWQWTAQQYLEEIPHLKRVKMNFLMNCYLSMLDDPTHRNLWWQKLPDKKRKDYERVVAACRDASITFCFAMHPQVFSDRPLRFNSDEDFESFFAHFAWMQSLGVKWFSISMDDVGGGDQGSVHAQFCNHFLERLRKTDPEAQLIFCPVPYAGSMIKGNESYLPELAKQLHPDVYLFWTGPEVVSITISRKDAEEFRRLAGHRVILWDNYPVNDGHPTMHLGPITGRDPELPLVVEGYMANPLYPQNRINRLPLYTMADYAYNPADYDPLRSIGEAVALLGESPEARRALAELVETYPGMILYRNGAPALNPSIVEFERMIQSPSGHALAAAHVARLKALLNRVSRTLHESYPDAEEQLRRDVAAIEQKMKDAYNDK